MVATQTIFVFSPLFLGEDEPHFDDSNIFQFGLVKNHQAGHSCFHINLGCFVG